MNNYRIKRILMVLLLTFPLPVLSAPSFSVIDNIDFGELFGLTGSCTLNGTTGVIGSVSGNFCFPGKTGTPGFYMINSSPFKVISIKINRKNNTGDGMLFMPSGIYRVTGETDIAIIPDQYQNINTGSTGILFIELGGTVTAAQPFSFSSSFSFTQIAGIEWNEQP